MQTEAAEIQELRDEHAALLKMVDNLCRALTAAMDDGLRDVFAVKIKATAVAAEALIARCSAKQGA